MLKYDDQNLITCYNVLYNNYAKPVVNNDIEYEKKYNVLLKRNKNLASNVWILYSKRKLATMKKEVSQQQEWVNVAQRSH